MSFDVPGVMLFSPSLPKTKPATNVCGTSFTQWSQCLYIRSSADMASALSRSPYRSDGFLSALCTVLTYIILLWSSDRVNWLMPAGTSLTCTFFPRESLPSRPFLSFAVKIWPSWMKARLFPSALHLALDMLLPSVVSLYAPLPSVPQMYRLVSELFSSTDIYPVP